MHLKTLAEHYLREGRPSHHSHNLNHAWTVHDYVLHALGGSGDPRDTADRFVFQQSPALAMARLIDSKALAVETLRTSVKMPSTFLWIEFPEDTKRLNNHYRVAFLVGEGDDSILVTEVMDFGRGCHPAPVSVMEFPLLPWAAQSACSVLWCAAPNVQRAELLKYAGSSVTGALFFLSVPRTIELREVKSARIRRIHEKQVYPDVEYKQVKLKIGGKHVQYVRREGESEAEYHKRLHHVIGHFRTYTHTYGSKGVEKRPVPKTVWIEPHWRGDASMGVLLREHIIETGEENKP